MNDNIPDNYDLFEQYEAERERINRMRKRIAHAYDEEREDIDSEG